MTITAGTSAGAATAIAAPEPAPGVAPNPGAVSALRVVVEVVEALGSCSADYDALTDAELLAGQRSLARLAGLVEARQVWLAKAVTHRSRRELGSDGLAARQGFLSPDELLQNLTGSTRKDARKLVEVGRMLADTEAAAAEATGAGAAEAEADRGEGADDGPCAPPDLFDESAVAALQAGPAGLPWYAAISAAVLNGTLSVTAAHAIRTGLGTVDTVVTAQKLSAAVRSLLEDAKTMNVDRLLKRARQMRDALDGAGVAVREQKAWDDRYLRIWRIDSGQVHIHGLFPPEQGEYIMSVYDSLTGPRRGGVRFVDPDRAAWAKAVQDDPRSTEQIAADTFLELLKAGSTVNPNRMLGGRTPAVRVLITAPPTAPAQAQEPAAPAPAPAEPSPPQPLAQPSPAPAPAPPAHASPPPAVGPAAHAPPPLLSGLGHGYLEGSTAAVSTETIDRLICDSGTVEVTFGQDGQPLNLGREERLLNPSQRAALAARDGGCRWGDCDRPPSATEAHHLEEWVRDRGTTDIRLGILLCNPHHRMLHNQGWQIFENQGRYWLKPPATVDPGRAPIELRSKNPTALR
jgi:hypothetical protein